MSAYRCFRCGRALSAEQSVKAGIGPICSAKQRAALDADRQLSKQNSTCHHGFTCYAPDHGLTTIGRFLRRFMTLADQTSLPNEWRDTASTLVRQYIDALGLKRKPVEVPAVDMPLFGDPSAIRELGLPIEQGPFGASVKMPADYEDQYRRKQLGRLQICPFGLDCREPGQAVAAVWNLLSLMRYQVEPWLKRNRDSGAYGWEWDSLIYQALANSLEVLGFDDDGRDIQDIAKAQRERKHSRRGHRADALSMSMW